MTRFSLGEQVVIRFGIQEGQRAKIIEIQSACVYKVKVEDGTVLYFSNKGLEKEKARI
jgi:hypothetical protein